MFRCILQFLLGFITNLGSILEINELIKNKTTMKYYYELFGINLSLVLINFIIIYFENYLDYLTNDTYFHFIYYSIYFIHNYLLIIPMYLICYIISLDKLGALLSTVKAINNLSKSKDETLDSKLYFTLVSTTFYFLINFLYYIPIIGPYISLVLTSYSYWFFCLEYCCYYKNINNLNKFSIIESNPYYFFGYGLIYGIIVQYLHYINFFINFVRCFFYINT